MALRLQLTAFLITFASVTVAGYSKHWEGRLRDYLLNQANYTIRDRPVIDSKDTVHVTMHLQLYAMLDLDERDEVLTTASWMNVQWQDEQLFWDPAEFGGVDLLVMHPDDIWIPKIFLSNSFTKDSLQVTSPDRGSIILTHQGMVDYGTPLVQSTHCPLNVRYFPYDTQLCPFYFAPVNQYHQHIRLTTGRSDFPSSISNLEWNLLNETIVNFVYPFSNPLRNGNVSYYSGTIICFYLQRNPNHYISTIIVPSTLMCVMAFATFLAPPDSGERISIGVSMVLGLTVFQLLISDTLPTSGKLAPVLSTYLTINFIFACMTVPLSLININIAYSDRKVSIVRPVWMKKILLEYLPFFLCVRTYDARVIVDAMKDDSLQIKNLGEVNHVKGNAENQSLSRNAVLPEEAIIMKDHLRNLGKTSCDCRTVAVVMDRLLLIIFLIAFLCLMAKTVVDFNANPGISISECA